MAYLIDHPPKVKQFYKERNRPLTGATVVHTAESVMDTVGPDTGAESVAEFIRNRTTAGSYHDIADSDSYVNLVPYESGAFHDGTGSNNWALSISFACGTHHWRQMTPAKRAGFLAQGARAFAAQQAWRRARGLPLTELRWITKAQSDAGLSGFIEHGRRDPGRRTDPGINPPNLFPHDEWLDACLAAMTGAASSLPDVQEDDMPTVIIQPGETVAVPSPYGDTDLWVACDNATGKTVDIDGKQFVVDGVDMRIAVQDLVHVQNWRPVAQPGFPVHGVDQFITAIGLGATKGHIGGARCVSLHNRGYLPVTATTAPHRG